MIPYSKQSLDAEDRAAVAAVLEGDWLTQGPAVSSFEEAIAARCGVPHAVAFSSGTAALHGAAFAAGVGEGDEIVTSAITFAASANCGAYLGARPRFADIEAETWNVSAATLEPAMTPRTKAVIPVHFAGLPAPIEPIRELVGPDVAIIEDAAHALGGSSGEGEVGSCAHSDMAIFSLHPTKAITSGEGGVVTTRDPELAERLAVFRHHGMVRDPERFAHPEGAGDEGPWYHEQQHLGFNYRLSDVARGAGPLAAGQARRPRRPPQRRRRPLPRGAGRDRRAGAAAAAGRRRPATPTTSSSSTCARARGGGSSSTSGSPRATSAPRSTTSPSTGTPTTAAPSATRRASAPRPSATTPAASRSPATRTSPPPTRTA